MRPPRLIPTVLALALASPAAADEPPPEVVASIAPLHSLVAGVTAPGGEPTLLVPPERSPHGHSLAPSHARALAGAELIVSAGGAADQFLAKTLSRLGADATRLRLLDLPGVTRHPARAGGAWRGGSGHDGHDREPAAPAENAGDGDVDPHAWLDPGNAVALTRAVARELARLDPARAAGYRARADARIERLRGLDVDLAQRLTPIADIPFLVFHDAYQYLERRYGLAAVGSIVVDPGRPPGARRLSALRDRIAAEDVRCIFVEPQFEPRIATSLVEGTGARISELDPTGAGLTPGPDLYFALMRRLARQLEECLAAER